MKKFRVREIDLSRDLERIVALSMGRDDLHPIEEIMRSVQQPYPWFDPRGFLVAEREGEIIGYIEGHLGYWQVDTLTGEEVNRNDDEIGCIERVLVHESHRRKGIGTALMKSLLEYLKNRRAKAVLVGTLASERKETAAKALYKKFGFREIYKWKNKEYGEMKMLISIL